MQYTSESPQNNKSGVSAFVSYFLSVLLTLFTQRILANNFVQIQDMHPLANVALFVLIFAPLQYLIYKFTGWLYSESKENDR